jgi:hypothetical protein
MSQNRSKLGPRTERIFKDIAERIIPSGGPDYPGAGDVGLADNIVGQLSGIPFARFGLSAVVWLWEISPFFFSLKFKPFSRMSPEDQTRYMEKWEKSRFMLRRLSLIGLKALFMMFFYSDPRIWEKIGYTEECLQKSGEDQGRGSEVGS